MAWSDIAVVLHPGIAEHVMPFPRPHLESFETPLRVEMIRKHLRTRGIFKHVRVARARMATVEDLRRVHTDYMIDTIRIMSDLGAGEVGESAYASPELYRSALMAVGGAVRAATLVAKEESRHSFSVMRPPGHHATRSTPMGLCYFNNIAVAIRHIQMKYEVRRVSVLDFDDHFGNGTAEIFYSDPDVQYISIHEYDYDDYGMGHFSETGSGDGEGTNINIPLLEHSTDESYSLALREVVVPSVEAHQPEIIAVSAGFDSHYADPVGNMNVDSSTFWLIGSTVRGLVESMGARGSFWVLEGGYNPLVLGPCVEASLAGLAGEEKPVFDDQVPREVFQGLLEANKRIISRVREIALKRKRS
ncbi:MAG: histone deacetylase [Candidatus Thorarchaeota archaeon]